jgi:hypothetical protein
MSMRRSLPHVVLTIVLAAMAGWVVLHREQINLVTLDAWLASLGPWAPIGHMMLFALGTVAFVPGVVFSLAGGALFGPFWGSLWNLAGATLGATLAFLVARYIAGDWAARKAGGLLQAADRRRGCGRLAFCRVRAAGAPLSFQSVELCAGAHAHSAPGLRDRDDRKHGPWSRCLYVAWSRWAWSAERRSKCSSLWSSWARPACCYRGATATDRPTAWIVRMDRSKRTKAPVRPERRRGCYRCSRTRRVHRSARSYCDCAQYSRR